MKTRYFLMLVMLALAACSKDDEGEQAPAVQTAAPNVTLMVTVNGLGDNGYNDAMVDGLFKFQETSGVDTHILYPTNMTEAEQLYQQWLTTNATADSSLLIVASTAYESMVSRIPTALQRSGSRVLLLESTAHIDGVSTVMINRYGSSYLAGALLGTYPAYVLAAMPGVPTLDRAIQGFKDGHDAHLGSYPHFTIEYLADGEEGFAMPDSAYRVMARRINSENSKTPANNKEIVLFHDAVFPLLGSSYTGAMLAMTDFELNGGVIVGIDTDRRGQSPFIPFSLVVRIDSIICDYLTQWKDGHPWPATHTLGLKENGSDILLNMDFHPNLTAYLFDSTYYDMNKVEQMYWRLKEEAIIKEEEYESKQH